TTDDHLMHIVRFSKDQTGKTYYKTKNSWGISNIRDGYDYVSPSYFKLKTIAIMVHKDAIPADIKAKLNF
ncbi:MAG: aminopeptidase, partial [Bacteroidetes bacterium]